MRNFPSKFADTDESYFKYQVAVIEKHIDLENRLHMSETTLADHAWGSNIHAGMNEKVKLLMK